MLKSPSLWITLLEVLVQTGQNLYVTNRQTKKDKNIFETNYHNCRRNLNNQFIFSLPQDISGAR